jgi:hypothetical protein
MLGGETETPNFVKTEQHRTMWPPPPPPSSLVFLCVVIKIFLFMKLY